MRRERENAKDKKAHAKRFFFSLCFFFFFPVYDYAICIVLNNKKYKIFCVGVPLTRVFWEGLRSLPLPPSLEKEIERKRERGGGSSSSGDDLIACLSPPHVSSDFLSSPWSLSFSQSQLSVRTPTARPALISTGGKGNFFCSRSCFLSFSSPCRHQHFLSPLARKRK